MLAFRVSARIYLAGGLGRAHFLEMRPYAEICARMRKYAPDMRPLIFTQNIPHPPESPNFKFVLEASCRSSSAEPSALTGAAQSHKPQVARKKNRTNLIQGM